MHVFVNMNNICKNICNILEINLYIDTLWYMFPFNASISSTAFDISYQASLCLTGSKWQLARWCVANWATLIGSLYDGRQRDNFWIIFPSNSLRPIYAFMHQYSITNLLMIRLIACSTPSVIWSNPTILSIIFFTIQNVYSTKCSGKCRLWNGDHFA